MAYEVIYHLDVPQKDLPGIPRNLRERIRTAIEERLIKDPVLTGKPLRQSLKGHRKMRVGDYRLIYRVDGSKIIILMIGHRKMVYSKIFGRM
jgi:mRNA interferase RelE/StbE